MKTLNNFGFHNPLSKYYGYKQRTEMVCMTDEKQKPKKTLRAGAITLTEWENTITVNQNGKKEEKTISKFVLEKSYKKGEDWKKTSSLDVNDIPKAVALMNAAYNEAVVKEQKEKGE